MNIQAEKVGIIEQVVKIQDENLLQAIRNLIEFGMQYQKTNGGDFWDELTEAQRERVEASVHQLDGNQGSSHDDIMTEFRQRYRL